MKTALITGSAGLIGSEAVRFFAGRDFKVAGIDNNMREYFFGKEASTYDIAIFDKNCPEGNKRGLKKPKIELIHM